jgi:hypothetical protein
MIKHLFFILALLVPVLAHGANPSAFFSDQIVLATQPPPAPPSPGSIPCDVGPNAVSIPAAAQAAGFTHCALNADFTQVGGYFGNLSNFVASCGGPTGDPNGWNGFRLMDWVLNPVSCDSSHIEITTDPLGSGKQVLHLKYPLSDQTRYVNCGQPVNQGNNCPMWTMSLSWPQQGWRINLEEYIATTVMIPNASFNYTGCSGCGANVMNLWFNCCGGTTASVAPDQFEIINTNNPPPPPARWNNGPGGCGYGCSQTLVTGTSPAGSTDLSTYHTVGLLNTADEVSTMASCTYIDSVVHHCYESTNLPSANWGQHPGWMEWEVGSADCYGHPGCLTHDDDVYMTGIQVWTCANYRTQTCPGPIITADNGKPEYYAQKDENVMPQELVKRGVAWLEKRVR